MSQRITGKSAVDYLETLPGVVAVHIKDNTDKFWSYRLRSGPQREFAFDPKTKTKLIARLDCEPPHHPDLTETEDISSASVSTALCRVFSGGPRAPKYKVTIRTKEGLSFLLGFLAKG